MVVLCLTTLIAYGQSKLNTMTPQLWEKDLNYLDKKIQKEFNSFIPGIKEEFSKEVAALRSKLGNLKNYEVAGEMMRILATLKDGHTELNIGHSKVGFHRVPLSLYIMEGEFYVLAAHEKYSHLVGGKITAIGNTPIKEAFGRLKQNMSHDNDMEFLHAGPGYIVLTELLVYLNLTKEHLKSDFTIRQLDGIEVKTTFTGIDINAYNKGPWKRYRDMKGLETPLYQSQTSSSYWYQYLPEGKTMYFNFSRVNNQKGKQSIKSFTKELFAEIDRVKPEKLVIDLRLNNGGNYHRSKPIVAAIKDRPWLNQKGKVWAITSRRTFSAASTMCIFLKQDTNAQIIGEAGRTHPNWADNNEYMTLPNSDFLIEYTTKIKKHWPEHPDYDRVPVDVEVLPTFEAYSKGIDQVMEYILKR